METRGKRGKERQFDTVIIDEADSMLIDNGGHLAKLSEPLPSMEYLEPLLIYIWHKIKDMSGILTILTTLVNKDLNEIESFKKIKDDLAEKVNKAIDEGKITLPQIKEQQKEIKNEQESLVVEQKDVNIFIPKHLEDYAKTQVNKWVDNAFKAAFLYKKDREYTIEEANGHTIIVPVDASNTGSLQKGMIWSDGLQQFLQLKHGLRLTAESCNTSYISNMGYIKRYTVDKDKNDPSIFGFTGTLGGEQEQDLLSQSYEQLSFLKIPTYKKKNFTKEPTLLKFSQDEWLKCIVENTIKIIETRAVLLICETIEEAKLIYEAIKKTGHDSKNLKLYLKDDQSNVTEERIEVGDILVATNLAGRGTDLKISDELASNGGMHVCVTFIPANQRVEEQALGRTARQGNPGSGQLIIKENKFVKELKKYVDEYLKTNGEESSSEANYIKYIEAMRDIYEKQRVEEIIEVKLKSIDIADKLFNRFSELCQDLKKQNADIFWFHIVIKAIEERWGFWLKEQGLDNKTQIGEREEQEIDNKFKEFEQGIKSSFKVNPDKEEILEVIRNPYYLIDIGRYCLKDRDFYFAKKALEKAILLANDDVVAAGAYYLLAFVEIELGKAAENILKKAVESLIRFLKFDDDDNDRKATIDKSTENLNKAKQGLEKIRDLYTDIFRACILLFPDQDTEEKSKASLLTEHLLSKITLLNVYQLYIGCNKTNIEKYKEDGEGYIAVKEKIKFKLQAIDFGGNVNIEEMKFKNDTEKNEAKENIKKAKEVEDNLKKTIKILEIQEVSGLGFNPQYRTKRLRRE